MSYSISRLETAPTLSPDEIEFARELFACGANTADIAKELNVTEALIYNSRPYLEAPPYLALPGTIKPPVRKNKSANSDSEPLAVLRQECDLA